jgi:hypothetical protein
MAMTDAAQVESMSLTEFARHIRRDESWVRRLRDAGRLAMTPGGRVRVRESLELMQTTAGDRPDVAERHAAARAELEAAEQPAAFRRERAAADLRRAQADAALRELELARASGEVLAREDAERAMRDLGATVRSRLDQISDRLAPELVHSSDLEGCRAIIDREVLSALTDISDALRRREAELSDARRRGRELLARSLLGDRRPGPGKRSHSPQWPRRQSGPN